MPKNKRPVIAVLLGQHEDLYAIHPDYLEAVWASGGLPVLIRYEETTKMLEELSPQGVLLTGGVFAFPNHLKEAKDMLPVVAVGLKHRVYARRDGESGFEIWRQINDVKRVVKGTNN